MIPSQRDTLVRALLDWADKQPDKVAQIYLPSGGDEEERQTFAEHAASAQAIAVRLLDFAGPGDRAILLCEPGLGFVSAFLGCLCAGIIPVPVYPPHPARPRRDLQRLARIAEHARPSVLLSQADYRARAQGFLDEVPQLARIPWVLTDQVPMAESSRWRFPDISGETVALIQYTSGSTADPKGVVVRHRNLMHNLGCIYEKFGHSHESLPVIWVPPYHDMGLIGGVLQPAYGGFPVVRLPYLRILQHPVLWLRAVSKYRATTSGGPDFGFQACVDRVTEEQRDELDLRCWRVAFDGSEPLHPETWKRFTDYFAPAGFDRRAFYPCYGLAESTLIVTGAALDRTPTTIGFDKRSLESGLAVRGSDTGETRELVSSGSPHPDLTLRIVDPSTARECGEGREGEVWIAGESVAGGYWNMPEETERCFGALLEGTDSPRFLRTGDMGFLFDGELFVTGRIKDLIILDGANHYPQDIEASVEGCHPALRPRGTVAFSVERDSKECLVIVAEVDPRRLRSRPELSLDDVQNAIVTRVAAQHMLRVDDVVLLEGDRVPRTTSGKLRRRAARQDYLRSRGVNGSADAPRQSAGGVDDDRGR